MAKRTAIGLVLAGIGSVGALAMLGFLWTAPAARSQPKSGIPGLTMKDVRDHKVLWNDIRTLERLQQQGRIDSEEYRFKAIELSAVYLEINDITADEFARVTSEAVTSIRASFLRMRQGTSGYEIFRTDMDAAEARVSAFLQDEPRHALFEPECGKWLRRLALGPAFNPKQG